MFSQNGETSVALIKMSSGDEEDQNRVVKFHAIKEIMLYLAFFLAFPKFFCLEKIFRRRELDKITCFIVSAKPKESRSVYSYGDVIQLDYLFYYSHERFLRTRISR